MAAGLGFKTFTTGEVLTAADVNGYLMQGVLVFASEAARNAAITSPQEGQFAYTKDNNSLWYYTGSAWAASGATGDIEGVTAGVGISGGGTSGTVTITNDMATTITASGDIVIGTGNGTYDNLPIGTTGQVLTADTTVSPYKVKWAAATTPSFVGCDLRKTANQSISNATTTKISFDSENFDTNGFHDNSTNNTRITIPSGYGGKYLFSFILSFENNSVGHRNIIFYVNGSECESVSRLVNSGSIFVAQASLFLNLSVGDYVEFATYQNSGSTISVNAGTASQNLASTRFSCQYLGA